MWTFNSQGVREKREPFWLILTFSHPIKACFEMWDLFFRMTVTDADVLLNVRRLYTESKDNLGRFNHHLRRASSALFQRRQKHWCFSPSYAGDPWGVWVRHAPQIVFFNKSCLRHGGLGGAEVELLYSQSFIWSSTAPLWLLVSSVAVALIATKMFLLEFCVPNLEYYIKQKKNARIIE